MFYDGRKDQKVHSPSFEDLVSISGLCKNNKRPFFLECDGAKRLPVKAPKNHEPPIPDFINKVCVVVGLKSLGSPICEETVYNSVGFAKITETKIDDVLSLGHLEKYLAHQQGGLKNILDGAKKILFINQADLIKLDDSIYDFCLSMKKHFDHVILCSITNNRLKVYAHYGKIACLILAAGEAQRFGSPKQLAVWKGKSLIEHVINNASDSHVDSIWVVLGAYADEIKNEIRKSNIPVVFNPNWQSGQASSVMLGIQSLDKDVDAALFLLVDQPQISPKHLNRLIHLFAKTKAHTLSYEFDGIYRHPVIFSKAIFREFQGISGDIGGRKLFKQYKPITIEYTDEINAFDIDRPDDLKRLN